MEGVGDEGDDEDEDEDEDDDVDVGDGVVTLVFLRLLEFKRAGPPHASRIFWIDLLTARGPLGG